MNRILPYLILPLLLVRIPYGPDGVDLSLFSNPDEWYGFAKNSSALMMFILACMVILFFNVWRYNSAIALFFGVAIYSSLFPIHSGLLNLEIVCIAFGLVFYLYCCQQIEREDFLNMVCVLCLAQSGLVILQWFGVDPIFHLNKPSTKFIPDGDPPKMLNDVYRHVGVFNSVNFASAFIAVYSSAFFRRKWWVLLPVPVAGLIITQSTGGTLAFILSSTFFIVRSKWSEMAKVVVILALAASMFGYSYIDRPDMTRLKIWEALASLQYNDQKEVCIGRGLSIEGLGLGAIERANLVFPPNIRLPYAANEYLQGLIEMGWAFIPVCILFFWFVFQRAKIDTLATMGVLNAVILAFVSHALRKPSIAAVSIGWLAMMDRNYLKGTVK